MFYDEDLLINAIKNCADFPIDIESDLGPDIVFDIVFKERIKQEEVDKITQALHKFFLRYNRWHLRPIHYISSMWGTPPKQINVFTVQIHIDFGNASPASYIGAVKAIANSGAEIYRLILSW